MDEPPLFVHDTKRIIAVNAAGCELFRCEEIAMVDQDMLEFLTRESDKYLLIQRMKRMRVQEVLTPFTYIFWRCDGSQFWATVTSEKKGEYFETRVIYIREV